MKYIYVVGKKWTRIGPKIAELKGCLFYFEMEYTRILLRFILLSDDIFEFVFIFADDFRVFYSFFLVGWLDRLA